MRAIRLPQLDPRWRGAVTRVVAALVLIGLAAGCGGGDEDNAEDIDIASVTIVSGDGQTGTVGTALPETLTVRLLTASGMPATGQTVTFAVAWGRGSVYLGTVAADAGGYARESWTLGTYTGVHRVDVRSITAEGAVRTWVYFTATAKSDAPAAMEAWSGFQTGVQTQPLPQPSTVKLVDRYGNACESVDVTFTADSGGSTSPSTARTDARGFVSTQWTLGVPLGRQGMVATAPGLEPVPFSAWAEPAPPTSPVAISAVWGDGQTIPQHTQLTKGLWARVTDQLGNGVPGVQVVYSGGTGITYFPMTTTTTDNTGTAYWYGYLHDAGDQTVTASAAGVGSVSFRISVSAAGQAFDGIYTVRRIRTGEQPYSHPVSLTNGGWSQVVRFEEWRGSVDPGTGLTTLRYRTGPSCWDILTGVVSFDLSGRAVGSGTLSATCDLSLPGTPVGTWTAERL